MNKNRVCIIFISTFGLLLAGMVGCGRKTKTDINIGGVTDATSSHYTVTTQTAQITTQSENHVKSMTEQMKATGSSALTSSNVKSNPAGASNPTTRAGNTSGPIPGSSAESTSAQTNISSGNTIATSPTTLNDNIFSSKPKGFAGGAF